MDNATIRTAAYLAARERLDARKTTRNVQCNPPNIRCGNRCIPPTWDCRLKGQGTDPHLRAVKTDPLGGLANIQRGIGRIGKGIVKGSFSDVEGGKSAIIRGAVKIAPGNIQQKAELKKKLENRTAAIGMGLAVVTGGLGIHALLMKNDTFGYRNGLGKQINESVHTGVSRVLDATPLLGAQRARTRVGAFSSITEAVTRSARVPQAGPDGLIGGLDSNSPETLRHLQNLGVSATDRAGESNLSYALANVNKAARSSDSTNVYAWNEKHQQAFWTAKKRAPDLDSYVTKQTNGKVVKAEISVFARPAAEDFLVKHYNLPIEKGGSNASATSIKDALANKLIEEREMHVAYAKQLGLKTAKLNKEEVIHPDAINTYLSKLNKNAGITGSGTVSKTLRDSADSHVVNLMSGKSMSARASEIYTESLFGFSKLYDEVASKVTSIPGVASLSSESKIAPSMREGTQTLLASLDRVRVGEMARALGLPRNQIAGEAHAELVRSAYFASNQNKRATFSITDRVALNAASELAGRPITQPTEAFRVLQSEHGFSGVTRVRAASSTSAPTSSSTGRVPRTGLGRQAALSSLARDIRARSGNEGMSMEAAYRAAKRELEGRSDARPELVRTATYLAVRADFKESKRLGKPCGASHIPKAHECRKGAGGREQTSNQSSTNKNKPNLKKAVSIAAGVGTAVVATKLLSDPQARQKLLELNTQLASSAKDAQYKVRQEALSRSIDGLSNKQLRQGLNKLPEGMRVKANDLVGKAKRGAAAMSLELAGYTATKVDTENNYISFANKQGDIKSIGSVGDSLVSYTFHDVQGEAVNILPKGRKSKHVVFQIDRKFDQKAGVSATETKAIKNMLTAMFRDSISKVDDGTLLLNSAWDKDGKGSGRAALYRRYGFNDVQGIDGMQWAVVENNAVKRIPKSEVMSEFMAILESGRTDSIKSKWLNGPS